MARLCAYSNDVPKGVDRVRPPPSGCGPTWAAGPPDEVSMDPTSAEAIERVLGPNKTPNPGRGSLERARVPDQEPTESIGGMGPLELDGAQMKR